jgi:hypothetical protein
MPPPISAIPSAITGPGEMRVTNDEVLRMMERRSPCRQQRIPR